jgi:hypothetical protein
MALGEGGDDRHGAAAAVPLIAGHEKHVAGIVRSGESRSIPLLALVATADRTFDSNSIAPRTPD